MFPDDVAPGSAEVPVGSSLGGERALVPAASAPASLASPRIVRRRTDLGAGEARRIAIAAAGLGEAHPPVPALRHVSGILGRLGLVQIDSVNVLARAHTVPFFSRLGPYEAALLDRLSYGGRRRGVFEYWGHEASLIRLDLQPALRWRMERARAGIGIYGGLARFGAERRPFVEAALDEVRRRGPLSARDLGEGGRGSGSWWGWSDGKRALEWLFWGGLLTTATRRGGFERVYDLPERVLPSAILDVPTPEPAEAHRILIRTAARALGIATEPDLRDYFRMDPAESRAALASLVEAGDLVPVTVAGWTAPAYLEPQARLPRRVEARAFVSPFDPLVWERARTERLFGFRYRIEIYVPAEKREHGYYVLPFFLGDRPVARLDLKADRAGGRLVVQAMHLEPGAPDGTREAIGAELFRMAEWLGLREGVHGRPLPGEGSGP